MAQAVEKSPKKEEEKWQMSYKNRVKLIESSLTSSA